MDKLDSGRHGRLEGLVALVTGGAQGLGLGISARLLAEGAKVCMAGRSQQWGDEAVDRLSQLSREVMFVACDVSDEAQVEACVAAAVERFGALHIVVNNAGGTTFHMAGGKACEMSLENFHRAFRVNTDGPFLLSKYSIPHMTAAGYGSIVNISSIAAVRASGNANIGYHASKAALHGLTISLANEYGPLVRCNEVVMGHLQPPDSDRPYYQFLEQDPTARAGLTAAFMVGRWGSPDDLGHVCAFLASPDSGFMTATTIRLDGGSLSRAPFPKITGFTEWLAGREVSAD